MWKALLCIGFLISLCGGQEEPDRSVLIDWYNQMTTKSFTWNTQNSLCGQHGIVCDGNNKVAQIQFGGSNIQSTLPTSLGLLTSLVLFNAYENPLTGTFPTEIGLLSNLGTMYMYTTSLNGTLPTEFGNLSKLTIISLFGGKLSGTIPTQLGNLKSLSVFSLRNNRFTGNIPTSIRSTSLLFLRSNFLNCPPLDYSSFSPSTDYATLVAQCNTACSNCPADCSLSGENYELNNCGVPCNSDSGFPTTESGNIATINNCPANQFGSSSRLCSAGSWGSIMNNCLSCSPNSYSMNNTLDINGCICFPGYDRAAINSTFVECSPVDKITDILPFRPIAIFYLDGNTLDSSGKGNTISISNYGYVSNFYNRANPNNQALRLNGIGPGLEIPNIPFDGSLSVSMIINVATNTRVFDLYKIVNSNSNAALLTVKVSPYGKLSFINSVGTIIGTTKVVILPRRSYFVIISYRQGLFSTFVDSAELGKFTINIPNGNHKLVFGSGGFDGFIDEIQVLDAAVFPTNFMTLSQRTRCIGSCPSPSVCYNTATSTEICANPI